MLQYFKLKVSLSTTAAMESMLRDVENAKKMNDKWTNLVKRRKDLSSDASALKVVILSQASWPSSTISSSKFSTKLPEKVSNWIQEYTKSIAMNEAHFAGAHFVVCESLGSVVMTLKFSTKKKYRIRASPSQASLILLLERKGELTFTEIENELEIQSDPLANLLISVLRKPLKTCMLAHSLLLHSSHSRIPEHYVGTGGLVRKILTKGQKHLPLQKDDKFVLNMNFQSKHFSFVLPKVSTERPGKSKVLTRRTQEAKLRRRFQIECCLIRIMKTHKIRSVKKVIQDTTSYLRGYFRADPKEIKRAIEIMQKRKYFEVKDSIVHYVA